MTNLGAKATAILAPTTAILFVLLVHFRLLSGEIPRGPTQETSLVSNDVIVAAEGIFSLLVNASIGIFVVLGFAIRGLTFPRCDNFFWMLLVLFLANQAASFYSIYLLKLDLLRLSAVNAANFDHIISGFGWPALFVYSSYCIGAALSFYSFVIKA